MNSVNLTGRLTRDVELRRLEGGKPVAELRIAVDNGVDATGSKRPATFVDVATFGAQAEACARYLAKGRQVAVSGRLIHREWEAEDGSKRSKHSVIGRVEFLGKGPGSAGADNGAGEPATAVAAVGPDDDEVAF